MIPLVQILRDHLNSESTEPFQTDWKELLALSKNHEVTAVVYSQCKDFIPQEILPEYERAYSIGTWGLAPLIEKRKNPWITFITIQISNHSHSFLQIEQSGSIPWTVLTTCRKSRQRIFETQVSFGYLRDDQMHLKKG